MRHLPRWLARTALVLLIPPTLHASPLGPAFTYQGELRESGNPMTGTVHLRFSLWDEPGTGSPPTGGTQIGASDVVPNVEVAAGRFSVEVNAGGEFGAQAFAGQARWLQIEVCADSACGSTTVLGPRQPVTAAPYALGPWQAGDGGLSYAGGHVGIGTATPTHLLHLKGYQPSIAIEDTSGAALQAGYISFRNGPSETGWMGYGNAGSPVMSIVNSRPNGDIRLWTTAAERMRVTAAGRVGIGTAAPQSKLDVRGDIALGPSGEFQAVGANLGLRIVRGVVALTGTRVFGTGFTSARTGTGVYAITFDTPFVDQPSIVATCQGTLDRIAVISSHLAGSCTIRVISGSGTPVDCYFDIIAIGRR